MTGLIGRVVLAVIVAVVVGIVLVALLGPILAGLNVPIAETVGQFFIEYGWLLGVLAGLWQFFAGGISWPNSA